MTQKPNRPKLGCYSGLRGFLLGCNKIEIIAVAKVKLKLV